MSRNTDSVLFIVLFMYLFGCVTVRPHWACWQTVKIRMLVGMSLLLIIYLNPVSSSFNLDSSLLLFSSWIIIIIIIISFPPSSRRRRRNYDR
jgi:uncharacterized membrane protein YjfL (UPF0719 family)